MKNDLNLNYTYIKNIIWNHNYFVIIWFIKLFVQIRRRLSNQTFYQQPFVFAFNFLYTTYFHLYVNRLLKNVLIGAMSYLITMTCDVTYSTKEFLEFLNSYHLTFNGKLIEKKTSHFTEIIDGECCERRENLPRIITIMSEKLKKNFYLIL